MSPWLEAVHLREDLVERLLALVVAAAERAGAGGARAADGVELVDEDDRRRRLLGLAEQVSHARGADADDRLDELGGAEMEKNGAPASPATARASSVLPVPGRAGEQHAARDPAAQALVALRVLEEVDDLGQLRLGLVDAGDVGERHVRVAGFDPSCAAAAEVAERAHLAAGDAAAGPDEEADEQDHGAEAEDQADQEAVALVDRLG